MNIFATSSCPVESARALDDVRLRKMIVETAQLLSTALRLNGLDDDRLYKVTHQNHPCAVWVRENRDGFVWTALHGDALVREYDYRWPDRGDRYAKAREIFELALNRGGSVYDNDMDFPNCTPYKDVADTQESYQLTMMDKWSNDRNPTWTRRGKPEWSV